MKKFQHHKKKPHRQSPKSEQTPLVLTIESLSPQAQGVATHDGKKYLVPFTLPDETVRVLPITQKKNTVFCELTEVIKKSPKRITPKCPYFGTCGGCDLQHMAYEDQLAFKQGWIETLLGSSLSPNFQPKADPPLADNTSTLKHLNTIIPSPLPFNYRNRITLHTNGKQVGYYKAFSHEIVAIERCTLLADDGIRTTDDNHSHFTQVNSSQNHNLIETVLNFCSDKKWTSALELYCGAGNLTFRLADVCKKIVAVDLDAEAIRLANAEKHESGKSNIKFAASSAYDAVFQHLQSLTTFELIVCDPPREGLKETAKLLPRLKPKQIVYVSCDPQTFLNDVKVLEDSGYKLTDVAPIDMFPQTHHVEVVGKLVLHFSP